MSFSYSANAPGVQRVRQRNERAHLDRTHGVTGASQVDVTFPHFSFVRTQVGREHGPVGKAVAIPLAQTGESHIASMFGCVPHTEHDLGIAMNVQIHLAHIDTDECFVPVIEQNHCSRILGDVAFRVWQEVDAVAHQHGLRTPILHQVPRSLC